jgi:hypothetical protein
VGPVEDRPDEDAEDLELPDTLSDDELDAAPDGPRDELDGDVDDELGDLDDLEGAGGAEDEDEAEETRHNALPRRLESWRSRTASGAVMSAMAMGLRQVFEPEQRKPAIVAEAPSDPYDDDDPIVVEYVADDASGTTVILRPWLMQHSSDAQPEPAAPEDEEGVER